MAKRVGLIGLGIMGSGMATQLLRRGFELTVWNRTGDKARALAEHGATVAASPAEVGAQAEVVITMVRDDAAVREVLLGASGALHTAQPGTTFIEMSTTTPTLAREMDEQTTAKNCYFLGAPVTGSKAAAESGELGILVSGAPDVLEANRDVLEAMSSNITYMGTIGASAVYKLANNTFAATLVAAFGEGLRLCEAAGLDRQMVAEALATTATRVCGLKKDKIINRDWSTDFALELMLKDLMQAAQTADELNVARPISQSVTELYAQAAQSDKGALDFAAITERN